jgi:hypothetical protein
MDIHKLNMAIMNIPCTGIHEAWTEDEALTYEFGHRDARHAAVEILLEYFKDVQQAAPEAPADAKDRRILFLDGLVRAYGPKSLQYDIEHPKDGLNADAPATQQDGAAVSADAIEESVCLLESIHVNLDTSKGTRYLIGEVLKLLRGEPAATTASASERNTLLEEAACLAKEMYESGEPAKRIRALKGRAPAPSRDAVHMDESALEDLMHKHSLIGVAGDNPNLEARLIAYAEDVAALAQQGTHGTPVTNSHASNAGEDTVVGANNQPRYHVIEDGEHDDRILGSHHTIGAAEVDRLEWSKARPKDQFAIMRTGGGLVSDFANLEALERRAKNQQVVAFSCKLRAQYPSDTKNQCDKWCGDEVACCAASLSRPSPRMPSVSENCRQRTMPPYLSQGKQSTQGMLK